jgi:hypothetical protein
MTGSEFLNPGESKAYPVTGSNFPRSAAEGSYLSRSTLVPRTIGVNAELSQPVAIFLP